jgi:hypothetical protein
MSGLDQKRRRWQLANGYLPGADDLTCAVAIEWPSHLIVITVF